MLLNCATSGCWARSIWRKPCRVVTIASVLRPYCHTYLGRRGVISWTHSFFYIYFNWQVSHIDFYFLQDCDLPMFINHVQKITGLSQLNKDWFQAALSLYGIKNLCMTDYITINHKMLNALVETWHSETSSFYLQLGDISITLDDVSCLLHLSTMRELLDHGRIIKDEKLEMMVDYLRADLAEANDELDTTRGLMLGLNTWKGYIQMSYR